MSPAISQIPDHLQNVPSTKTNIIQATLEAQKPKPKLRIILNVNYGCYKSPEGVFKGREESSDYNDEQDDDECDCQDESNTGRTRSQQPELLELSTPTHSRRPKLYPSLTPWGDYWNYRTLNDFYPEKAFKWDDSDVPDFDLGEPLDETNFWEEPWIAATEKKKMVRYKREEQRKRRQRYGGLTAEGRKRAYRKRIGVMRENGMFIRSRIVGGS